MAWIVRTLAADIPTDKCESELLDWLIHGDSSFSKKYVVLHFMDRKDGDDGYSGRVAFEIRRPKYMPFYDYCCTICSHSEPCGDNVYLEDCELIDRVSFLQRFNGLGHVVDRKMLKRFKKDALDDETIGEWAWENRDLVHSVGRVEEHRFSDDEDDSDSTYASDLDDGTDKSKRRATKETKEGNDESSKKQKGDNE